jgi:hypothetical protein
MTKPIAHRPLVIPYRSHDFGSGSVVNGRSTLTIWPEKLFWAAVTVGRANILDVLAHGLYSEYEIIYRVSIVLANLVRTGNNQLRKSPAFTHLDPSEKGAISYFLGMTMSKLFASELLHVPWMLHFDVYEDSLNAVRPAGSRDKPDMIGRGRGGDWLIMESKGRSNGLTPDLLTAGKRQTQSVRTVAGQTPHWRIAAVTHFGGGTLTYDWADPDDFDQDAFDLKTTAEEFLSLYYKLIYTILSNNDRIESEGFLLYRFAHLGFTIGLQTSIFDAYSRQQLTSVKAGEAQRFRELPEIRGQQFFIGTDGVAVGISQDVRELLRYE